MTAISLLLVVLVSLAWIIAGETPGCPLPAKVAAAQVYANRVDAGIEGGWFGWARPGPLDRLAVAMAGQAPDLVAGWSSCKPRSPPSTVAMAGQAPDLVAGALYFIGPGDAERMPWLQARTGRWECVGTWVESWR